MKKNFDKIDIWKFIFSICIIALHTLLLTSFDDSVNWYITHGLFRLAVPFFFVVAGFFYGRKIVEKKGNIKKITSNYIKKIFCPFLFWLGIGLPAEFINTYNGNVIDTMLILIKKVFFYPWGALWYLLALMVAVWILSKFYQKNSFYLPVLIGFFLYLFALVSNSYYFIIDNIPIFRNLIDLYNKIFISSRNGIFVGILLVSIGVIISKMYRENKLFRVRNNIFGFLLCYILLILEMTLIRNRVYMDDHSLFIIMPVLMFFLISLLLQFSKDKSYLRLRNYSIILYLVHRPVIAYIKLFFDIAYGIDLFTIVFPISIILSYLLRKSKIKFIKLVTMT